MQVKNTFTCLRWRVGFSYNFMWKVKLFNQASWNVIQGSENLWHFSGLTSGPKFLCSTLMSNFKSNGMSQSTRRYGVIIIYVFGGLKRLLSSGALLFCLWLRLWVCAEASRTGTVRGTYHVVRCIGGGGVGGISAVRFTRQVQLVTEAGLRDVALQQRVNTTETVWANTHANCR